MLSETRQYEMMISDRGWVKATDSEDNRKLKSQLLYLRRLHYFPRYRDIVGRLSHQVGQGVANHKVESYEMLSAKTVMGGGHWTGYITRRVVHKRIVQSQKNRKFQPNISAVMETCIVIGTHFHRMIRAIQSMLKRDFS